MIFVAAPESGATGIARAWDGGHPRAGVKASGCARAVLRFKEREGVDDVDREARARRKRSTDSRAI
jgi:hypothetical protein